MLLLSAPVSESSVHMFEPIAKQALHKLIKRLGCAPLFQNRIYITSDTLGTSKSFSRRHNPILRENRVDCNIRPTISPYDTKVDMAIPKNFIGMGMSNYERNSRMPIFYDKEAHTKMIEHEIPAGIIMEVTFTFVSSPNAFDILSRLPHLYTTGDRHSVDNVVYDYPVPAVAVNLLYNIFKLKGGKDPDFVPYLQHYSDQQITLNVNRLASGRHNREVVINRTIVGLLGQIDISSPDKAEANKNSQQGVTYSFNFTYNLQFNRPSNVYVEYPIAVNNQLVPEKALFLDPDRGHGPLVEQLHPFFAFEGYRTDKSTGVENVRRPSIKCARLPWYDNWVLPPTSPLPKKVYRPFLIAHFTLDNLDQENGYTEIDLGEDLGGYKLSEPIINLIKVRGARLFELEQPMNISVYADDVMLDPVNFELVGYTKLRVRNSDPKRLYRLVLSEYYGYGAGYEDIAYDYDQIANSAAEINKEINSDGRFNADPASTEYGTLNQFKGTDRYGNYKVFRVALYDLVTFSRK